ncbi:MAG: CBS domain-containing protein [Syntrophomonadaceae bacterium]|nr:CBS domain-containing protein [Syntrophomonadaceae bacterium]
MDIITSHNALDFDGLASMVAAGKLYPGAVKVFSGTLSKNVRQFLALYKDSLIIKSPREIDLSRVKRMILVDTANINRLGHLKSTAAQSDMEFYIYDHHPVSPDDLRGPITEIHNTGAATTILVEKILDQGLTVSSFEATILALGIYEDTGSLLFPYTTPRDLRAVSNLLEWGANLSVVANFMDQPFSGEQRQLLQQLLNTARHYRINNIDVVIAVDDGEEFIPGLDIVTHRLFEMENSDVIFVLARMEGRIHVVSRSRTGNIKVNDILRPLGGRGHDKAASAVVKAQGVEEIIGIITAGLGDNCTPGMLAKDIMSTPVKTIPMSHSMEEAGKIMLRYGHTGMPVVENDQMVGVISRRDVDKARIHDLGHAPVKGFMTTAILSVEPETPVNEIQRLMVEHDIGRLPVVENGKLVGIVSRTDILRTLHGEDYPEDHEVLYSGTGSESEKENCWELMHDRLPSRILTVLKIAGEIAEEHESTVYCVGGFVRDLFIRVPNFDVDLVVEGDGESIARSLAQKLGGKERIHPRFKTGVVVLPDGFKIDVATARTEYYEFPAALPTVEKSSIREDMYRRDFTINTLAICLNPDSFGNLIDYFGGRKDIENGFIRVLYNLSFVEDPTRVLRAIRFEQRYRFTIEPDTLRFAKDAIDRNMLGKLSHKRILQELILILNEKDPVASLYRMREIGVWKYILPEVDLQQISRTTLRRIPVVIAWWQEREYNNEFRAWLVYIMVILAQLSDEQIEEVISRYYLDQYASNSIRNSRKTGDIIRAIEVHGKSSPADIHEMIAAFSAESLVYLLLTAHNENTWETLVHYLEAKDKVKVEINGHDLKAMGLKPGPLYSSILSELYRQKMNGLILSKQEELLMVAQWIEEDKFINA